MTPPKQDRQSARRVVRLLFVLQGHVMEGLYLSQIAEKLGTSLTNVLRDLEMLADEGIAERIPGRDKYWRLTPTIVQISRATGEEFARLHQRIEEFEQRYSREPK